MGKIQKIAWQGRIVSIQPRIRLNRSFDERSHGYPGYVLQIDGTMQAETRTVVIAIGKAAQAKHAFCAGDEVAGESLPVADERLETAGFYKTSGLKVLRRWDGQLHLGPPFLGVPPALEVYRKRGHRRLAARRYETRCITCIWGCRMPVEMTIDHWKPEGKRYRFETHCYGPLNCKLHKAGPTRKVPGRKGMQWVEEDWVDEQATEHRGPDE